MMVRQCRGSDKIHLSDSLLPKRKERSRNKLTSLVIYSIMILSREEFHIALIDKRINVTIEMVFGTCCSKNTTGKFKPKDAQNRSPVPPTFNSN